MVFQKINADLIDALKTHKREKAEDLIANGADINVTDQDGNTPLLIAAQFRFNNLVEEIVKAGADLSVINSHGSSIIAYYHDNPQMLKFLMSHGLEYKVIDQIEDKQNQVTDFHFADFSLNFIDLLKTALKFDKDNTIKPNQELSSLNAQKIRSFIYKVIKTDCITDEEFAQIVYYNGTKNTIIEGNDIAKFRNELTDKMLYEIQEKLLVRNTNLTYAIPREYLPDYFKQNNNVLKINQSNLNHKQVEALLSYLATHSEITELDTSYYNNNELLIAITNSNKSKNITNLNLNYTDITDAGLEKLPSSLTSLNVVNCRITVAGIEKLAETRLYIAINNEYKVFYNLAVKVKDVRDNPSFDLTKEVKDVVFNIAPHDREGAIIKHILNNQEKYPFLVNSQDKNGHNLMHFYTHSPQMQALLFKKGMIPAKEVQQDDVMRSIVRDNQSVHASEVTKRTNFFTKELVQNFGDDYNKLTKAAEHYKDNVMVLFNINPELAIKLLDLTTQEKRSVMEKTLSNNDVLPSDEEFIKIVIQEVFKVLDTNYLRKASDGKYDQGYPTATMQYDWTTEQGKKITIPESLGLISELASATKPNLSQMKELTATLLTKQQNKSKSEAHHHIESFNENEVKALFKEVSAGLDIEQVYEEQQKFKLAKQLYVAATTYGNNSNACTQGTWAQIITAAEEIDPKISDQWGAYKEAERAKDAQKNNITDENIMPLVTACAKECLLKKDGEILTKPNLQEPIIDLATVMLDINNPEAIRQPQQQVLSSINTYFSEHVKEYLPNYARAVPKLDEYNNIIELFSEVPEMQTFAQNPDEYFNVQCVGATSS